MAKDHDWRASSPPRHPEPRGGAEFRIRGRAEELNRRSSPLPEQRQDSYRPRQDSREDNYRPVSEQREDNYRPTRELREDSYRPPPPDSSSYRPSYDRPPRRSRSRSFSPSRQRFSDRYEPSRSPRRRYDDRYERPRSPPLRYSDRSDRSPSPRYRHVSPRRRTPTPPRRGYEARPRPRRYESPARDDYDEHVVRPVQPPRVKSTTATGDNDLALNDQPSQFLIFRGLEPSVTEELLVKGAAKLLYHTEAGSNGVAADKNALPTSTANARGASPDSIRRVFVIKDRRSGESWRYGFVEFANEAQAAVQLYNASDRFTISSKPVLVNYTHAGVFVPNIGDSDARFSFGASHDQNLRLEYRDKRAYASELLVHIPEPDTAASAVDQSHVSAQNDRKGSPDTQNANDGKENNASAEGNSKKRKATKPASDKFAFWNRKTAELHGQGKVKADERADLENRQENGLDKEQGPANKKQRIESEGKSAVPSSFVEPKTSICYLCQTKLKPEMVVRHEKESKLHLANLNDSKKCDYAVSKLGYDPRQAMSSATSDAVDENEDPNSQNGSVYKDRAAERRAQFSQPKQPSKPFKGFSLTQKDATPEPQTEEPPPKASKGTAMLAAMGYDASSGKGLGAGGTGMTDALTQNVYAGGVGLGAQGGVIGDAVEVAAKKTKGEDWKSQKDSMDQKTRARYQQAG
ncbi:MAG: hypothetical protein M1828_006334 [Chrysothrix sp. TS-e1954]|nr:MAG: hypothetical protein M1828_006334 [Chrysothrix sp. TS-e1954]